MENSRSMTWNQKWRTFWARRYIKKFEKYFPYIDMKTELSGDSPELPLKIIENLLKDDPVIMQSTLKSIYDMDEKLVENVLADLLSYHTSGKINLIQALLKQDSSASEDIILWYIEKNPDFEYSLVVNSLLENSDDYFNVTEISEKIVDYFQKDYQVLIEILSADDKNREIVIKKLIEKYPLLGKEIIAWYLCQEPNYKYSLALNIIQGNSNYILGGISRCIYSTSSKILMVDGWYLPKSHYNAIAVYMNGNLLGTAACGIKRMDVYRNYPEFNEKFAGFRFTVKCDKNITENDIVVIQVLKDDILIRKTQKNISLSTNELSEIINAENTPEMKLEIMHNDLLVDFINLNEIKNIKNLFQPMDYAIRAKHETGWKIRSILNDQLEREVPLISHPITPENYDEYSELIEDITENTEFYKTYLLYNNYKRVYQDYQFIKNYISVDSQILDIGAIPPLLESMIIKGQYRSLTVLDPNAVHFSSYFNKHKIHYVNGNIFSISSKDITNKYDFVIFAEVLEHLSGNLIDILKKLNNYVAEGGYLYITTPNLKSISGLYGLCMRSSGLASKYRDTVLAQHKRYEDNGYFGHLREYTPKEVIDLLSNFGFELVEKRCLPEYRNEHPFIIALEELYPEWGIWGKYLFKKTKI